MDFQLLCPWQISSKIKRLESSSKHSIPYSGNSHARNARGQEKPQHSSPISSKQDRRNELPSRKQTKLPFRKPRKSLCMKTSIDPISYISCVLLFVNRDQAVLPLSRLFPEAKITRINSSEIEELYSISRDRLPLENFSTILRGKTQEESDRRVLGKMHSSSINSLVNHGTSAFEHANILGISCCYYFQVLIILGKLIVKFNPTPPDDMFVWQFVRLPCNATREFPHSCMILLRNLPSWRIHRPAKKQANPIPRQNGHPTSKAGQGH